MASYTYSGCCYVIRDHYGRTQKHHLTLIESTAHSTILSTTSRTTLKQIFTNSSESDAIPECMYTFPLFDGVSVISFTCRIGERAIRGVVQEKVKAKATFDRAVAAGETAGLLEQATEAADVFSTKLGNVAAGQKVTVEISYIGELKHDDSNGLRFTIPTQIIPRYGAAPSLTPSNISSTANDSNGIQIIVDIDMPGGSTIQGVQSPSHPIAVSMGVISTATDGDPTLGRASATLSLGSTALEKDFVLIVNAQAVGIPKALLETHPTIPNHRALMVTLVPKFNLPPLRPEIVFVVDRSGSMHPNMQSLVSAMQVFLRSIPTGVKFNICSFGSSHQFLWEKSRAYSQETLEEASDHVSTFAADMGGTQTFNAIEATIDLCFTDMPLEIMLLTDGDIWQQEELFDHLNQQVRRSKGNIRVFPLGLGNQVSHSLIEGVARAGNGFAQAVQLGERLDNAVVRMLRGALSCHLTDYSLDVKYEQQDDDFELVESVSESKRLQPHDQLERKLPTQPTISPFGSDMHPESENIEGSASSLPDIPYPKLLQAPYRIHSLFAFSRTTVYILMSPETIQRNLTAVILHATSAHGPLTLEIPIEVLPGNGEIIHQLAAKKAVQDLEEGRGWIYHSPTQDGTLIRDEYPSSFEDLVRQEAVRLGETFQVAGKWCSFVAVTDNDNDEEHDAASIASKGIPFHVPAEAAMLDSDERKKKQRADGSAHFSRVFHSPAHGHSTGAASLNNGAPSVRGLQAAPAPSSLVGQIPAFEECLIDYSDEEPDENTDGTSRPMPKPATPPPTNWNNQSVTNKVLALISLQDFSGSWSTTDNDGSSVLGFPVPPAPAGVEGQLWLTWLVVRYLEDACAEEEGAWGLVVEKARAWLMEYEDGNMGMAELDKDAAEVVRKLT